MSKRTKKHRRTRHKKNVARGRTRRTTVVYSNSPKRVKINTPENIIREYSLGSSEREWKQRTPTEGIHNCKKYPKKTSDFPCRKKNTIFRNKKEYEDYKELKSERNKSVGYKSKSEHYDDIETMLMSQGYNLLR